MKGMACGSVGLAVIVAVSGARAEPARYTLDPEHTTIAFLVHHIGYAKVLGVFRELEGSFMFDEETGTLSDILVSVQSSSVDTHHDDRDEHIRSDDFLDAREFPTVRFAADTGSRTGERSFDIEGRLQLLGRELPLTLNAVWNKSAEYPIAGRPYVIGVSARTRLNRSDYGMSYALDNGWVGDEVDLIIEFEARRN